MLFLCQTSKVYKIYCMTRIIQGVLDFQRRVFGEKQTLFGRLAKGQQPLALFITCSDSRINPNLITQTEPGELFILRNAGNLVPPHDAGPNGEAATIEYAVAHLKVREIVVCGHSHCGAMHGLLAPDSLRDLPNVAGWLSHAQAIVPAVHQSGLSDGRKLGLAIEKNVLLQMEHLRSHPAVAVALAARALRLHGWVYHLENGEVTGYDPIGDRFTPLSEMRRHKWTEGRPAKAVQRADRWESM